MTRSFIVWARHAAYRERRGCRPSVSFVSRGLASMTFGLDKLMVRKILNRWMDPANSGAKALRVFSHNAKCSCTSSLHPVRVLRLLIDTQ